MNYVAIINSKIPLKLKIRKRHVCPLAFYNSFIFTCLLINYSEKSIYESKYKKCIAPERIAAELITPGAFAIVAPASCVYKFVRGGKRYIIVRGSANTGNGRFYGLSTSFITF